MKNKITKVTLFYKYIHHISFMSCNILCWVYCVNFPPYICYTSIYSVPILSSQPTNFVPKLLDPSTYPMFLSQNSLSLAQTTDTKSNESRNMGRDDNWFMPILSFLWTLNGKSHWQYILQVKLSNRSSLNFVLLYCILVNTTGVRIKPVC